MGWLLGIFDVIFFRQCWLTVLSYDKRQGSRTHFSQCRMSFWCLGFLHRLASDCESSVFNQLKWVLVQTSCGWWLWGSSWAEALRNLNMDGLDVVSLNSALVMLQRAGPLSRKPNNGDSCVRLSCRKLMSMKHRGGATWHLALHLLQAGSKADAISVSSMAALQEETNFEGCGFGMGQDLFYYLSTLGCITASYPNFRFDPRSRPSFLKQHGSDSSSLPRCSNGFWVPALDSAPGVSTTSPAAGQLLVAPAASQQHADGCASAADALQQRMLGKIYQWLNSWISIFISFGDSGWWFTKFTVMIMIVQQLVA